jgi:hypothetical protein
LVAQAASVFDEPAQQVARAEPIVEEYVANVAVDDLEPAVEYRAEIAEPDFQRAEVGAAVVDATASQASALSFEDELDELLGQPAALAASVLDVQPAAEPATEAALEFDALEFEEPLDLVADELSMEAAVEPELIATHVGANFEPMVEDISAVEADPAHPVAEDEIEFEFDGSLTADDDLPVEAAAETLEADAPQDELDAAIAELEEDASWETPIAYEPVAEAVREPVVEAVQPPRSRFSFVHPEEPVEPARERDALADDPFAALAAMAAAPPILRTLKRSNPVAVNPEYVRPGADVSAYSPVAPAPAPVAAASAPVARTYAPAPSVPAAAVAPVAAAAATVDAWPQPVQTPIAPVEAAAEPEFDVADFDLELESDSAEAFVADTQDWQIKPSVDYDAASPNASFATEPAIVDDEFSAAFDVTDEHVGDFANAEFDDLLVDDFVSELETVEVPDNVVAVADDLDLPDLQLHEEPKSVDFDDFDTDFADAFRQLGEVKRPAVAAVSTAPAAPQTETPPRTVDEMLDADFASFQRDFEANESAFDAAEGFDFEPTGGRTETHQRSKLPLYGAIFAGLLLFAGAGAYAFGMFGSSDSGPPALVRADATPVKVKPETPGGVVVPNQNGQVYDRVAGADPKAPAQEKLVSKVEEPIVRPAKPAGEALPGVDSPSIKSEERVVPEANATAPADGQAVGIAPKKVRTMVVRPDGTLAPRPEPVAAPVVEVPAAKAVEPVVVAPAKEGAKPAEVAAATPEPVAPAPAKQDAAPVEQVLTPKPVKTTTIKPKPAPEPAAEKVAAAPAPAPVDMAGGAAAASTEAASGQFWNVQIASQPTREGAQSSYESLARKYGGVIGGKGVNIVQANIEGKGTMWRVRIPAATKNDANILCAKLKTAGGSCFVSR